MQYYIQSALELYQGALIQKMLRIRHVDHVIHVIKIIIENITGKSAKLLLA